MMTIPLLLGPLGILRFVTSLVQRAENVGVASMNKCTKFVWILHFYDVVVLYELYCLLYRSERNHT